MPSIYECAQLIRSTESLGVTPPAALTSILANYNEAEAGFLGDPMVAVTDAINTGTLNGDIIRTTVINLLVQERAGDLLTMIAGRAAQAFTEQLRGAAGDALIRGIRPKFDKAAAAITSLGYSYNATAAEILAIDDPKAIEGWRTAGKHKAVLDAVFNLIVTPMVNTFGIPGDQGTQGIVPEQMISSSRIAWLIDGQHRGIDQSMSRWLAGPTTDPAGLWHGLITEGRCVLKLNTPAEAQRLLTDYINGWRQANSAPTTAAVVALNVARATARAAR